MESFEALRMFVAEQFLAQRGRRMKRLLDCGDPLHRAEAAVLIGSSWWGNNLFGKGVLLVVLLSLAAGSLQAQLTNLSFEADAVGSTAVTDWLNMSPAESSAQVSALDPRSGSRTLAYTITGTLKAEMRSVSSTKVRNNGWVHVVAWALAKNAKAKASLGLAVGMENSESSTITLTPGNSRSKLNWDFQYTRGGTENAYVKLIVTPINGAASTVYWDDVVVYTNWNAPYPDATAPEPPGAATVSSETGSSLRVSWVGSAGDNDSYSSGLAGYLVVRGTSDPTTVPLANATYRTNYNSSVGSGTVVYNGSGTSFTDSGLPPGTTYFYRVYAFDNALNYSIASTASGMTTCGSPTPSVPTANPVLPVCGGTAVTLTQAAGGGSAPYSYQWKRNGEVISGATASAITIPEPVQGDSYCCDVRSNCGGDWATSPTLELQVSQPPALAPLTPASLLRSEGESVVLRAEASGTGLSYQWRKEGVALDGATGSALTLSPLRFVDAGRYDVVIVNGACATNSSEMALGVNRLPVASTLHLIRARSISLKISLAELLSGCSDPDQDPISFLEVDSGQQGAQVSYDSNFIYYLPVNDQDDVLSYRVGDNRGGSRSGRVEIGVVSEVVEARAISVVGGIVRVRFAGIPGHRYRVERTVVASGTDWEAVGQGVVPGGGVFEFEDRAAPAIGAYYRLEVEP